MVLASGNSAYSGNELRTPHKGAASRKNAEIVAANRKSLAAAFLKSSGVSGYNLDEFVQRNFNLSKLVVGSEAPWQPSIRRRSSNRGRLRSRSASSTSKTL